MNVLFYDTMPPFGVFSNFSKHSVAYRGFIAKTSEHMFQAMKFYPDNLDVLQLILDQPTPRKAADMGRNPKLPCRADWNSLMENLPEELHGTCIQNTKDFVMYEILTDKFTRYSALKEILLSTVGDTIIENSKVDSYWGCGETHNGQNKLGRILMVIRDQICRKIGQ